MKFIIHPKFSKKCNLTTFRPIAAASLALALSEVAIAATSTPTKVVMVNNKNIDKLEMQEINSSGIYNFAYKNGASTIINNMIFDYNKPSTPGASGAAGGLATISGSDLTVNSKVTGSTSGNVKIDNKASNFISTSNENTGKTIKMGNDGTGNLEFKFYTGASNTKATLNFYKNTNTNAKTDESKYGLIGNIKTTGETSNGIVTATFNEGSNLKGNITNGTGNLTLNFEGDNALLDGTILTNANGVNTNITFKGDNSTIGTLSTAKSITTSSSGKTTTIEFKKGGSINGMIEALNGGKNDISFGDENNSTATSSYNAKISSLKAETSNGKNTIAFGYNVKGTIDELATAANGTNTITFKNTDQSKNKIGTINNNGGTTNIKGSVDVTSKIQSIANGGTVSFDNDAKVSAIISTTSNSANTITFESTASITSEIASNAGTTTIAFGTTSSSGKSEINSINNKSNTNITFNGEGVVKGAINNDSSASGTIKIDFKSSGTINNDIATKGGTNTITFEKGGTITGSIKSSSANGKNYIYLGVTKSSANGAENNAISFSKISDVISAEAGVNTIIFGKRGGSGTTNYDEIAGAISASSGGKNDISFYTDSTTLPNGKISSTISTDATSTNNIAFKGQGSILGALTSSGTTNISFDKGGDMASLNINGGTSKIDFGARGDIKGDIKVFSGSLNITFDKPTKPIASDVSSASTISTVSSITISGGTANITFGQEGEIKGPITTKGGTLNLDFNNGGTIDGSILTSSGTTNIKINSNAKASTYNISTTNDGETKLNIANSANATANITYSSSKATTVAFSNGDITKAKEGIKLVLQNSANTKKATIKTTSNAKEIEFIGEIYGTLTSLASSTTTSRSNAIYNSILASGSRFVGAIDLGAGSKLTLNSGALITLKAINSTLNSKITNLSIAPISRSTSPATIDLATYDLSSISARDSFSTFTIGSTSSTGLTGSSALFRVYANVNSSATNTKADKIIINSGDGGKHLLQVNYDEVNLAAALAYDYSANEIIVAEVNSSTSSATAPASFTSEDSVTGFTKVHTTLAENKLNDKTTYKIIGVNSVIDEPYIAVSTAATSLDISILSTNLNSLNYRFIQLRKNANIRGIWARIFGGSDINNIIPTDTIKSKYITTQAGFDSAISSGMGFNDFLGIYASYSTSTATLKPNSSTTVGLDAKVQNIELGLYNAYIRDSGIYSNATAKFVYFINDYTITSATSSTAYSYAIALSEQLGYRAPLDIDIHHSFYLDPKYSLIAAYMSAIDFTQHKPASTLTVGESPIFMLRNSLGLDLGYKYTSTDGGFGIDFRIGAAYIYDLFRGGNLDFHTMVNSANLKLNRNDNRLAVNAGLNMTIATNSSLYLDFEKSFLGRLNTDYMVDFGFRYSFGVNAKYQNPPKPKPEQI